MEADKIRQAIINKAEQEAAGIVDDAQARARELIDRAEKNRDLRFEQIKNKILSDARQESAKILAKGSVDARLTILEQKDILLQEVISLVKKELSSNMTNPQTWNHLIEEIISGLEKSHEIRFCVASKDVEAVRKIVADNDNLKKQVAEIKEIPCLGGVLAEDDLSKVSIDNTYDTRLEMLLNRILPDIGNKLFGETTA
jgi:vacuolar-type H+-ATPase subunit E/Vma4